MMHSRLAFACAFLLTASSLASASNDQLEVSSGNTKVNQNCVNNQCEICVKQIANQRCFHVNGMTNILSRSGCPVAACNCGGPFVMNTDNCPICRCNGYATRELCDTTSDCGSGGTCKASLCTYAAVSASLPLKCTYSYECKSTETCQQPGKCVASEAQTHAEGVSCLFTNQCPDENQDCHKMTCWNGASMAHVPGVSCVFNYQCPSGYSCTSMTCYKDGTVHGTTSCVFDQHCAPQQRCVKMTCQG